MNKKEIAAINKLFKGLIHSKKRRLVQLNPKKTFSTVMVPMEEIVKHLKPVLKLAFPDEKV